MTEAGEIQRAEWHRDRKRLARVRKKVFIDEQNVPESMEWDEYDELARHYMVNIDGQVVATARLVPVSHHEYKIGRMAVLPEFRNRGIGSALLQFIIDDAKILNISKLVLHAQVSAISFYESAGFECTGSPFDEAGIPHHAMLMQLDQD
jgi:predicted GNAT family N-acyltransferase